MGYLDSLAQGLRLGGGVLNPQVQQMNQQNDINDQNALRQRQQFLIAQALRAAETGAADPMQVQQFLKQQGVNVPESFVGPDQQTQARQQALKNEQAFRAAMQQNPDASFEDRARIATEFGKPELAVQYQKAVEDRAARKEAAQGRAQQAADMLDFRKSQLDQQYQLGLQSITNKQQKDAFEEWYKTESLKNAAERDRQAAEFKRMGIELRSDALKNQQSQKIDSNTQQFANKMEQAKVPQLLNSVDRVNQLFSEYVTYDPKNKEAPYRVAKEIPGLGYGTTLPGAQLVMSERGNLNRSAVASTVNDLLNMYSGLAVTLPESQRRDLEMMASGKYSEQDFINAWPKTVEFLNKVIGNFKAGYGPEVVNRYSSRPGAIKLEELKPFNKSGSSQAATLTPAEQAELDALKKRFNK